MHITYVSFCQIPSFEAKSIQAVKVCQATKKMGYRTTLIVPDTKTNFEADLDATWRHYGINERFSIHALPAPVRGFSYYSFPRFITAHIFAWQSVSYAHIIGSDLIYTWHLPTAVLASQKGLATVYEIHEISKSFKGQGKLTGLYLHLLRKGKGFLNFVILTEALKSDLLQEYPSVFKDAKIIVAPDGVDLEQFQNLPDPKDARDAIGLELRTNLVAGYAGSFYPQKGVQMIYELARRCPEIKFLLMGGEPKELVEFYNKKYQIYNLQNIIQIGLVDQTDLPLYLAACDVLLLPNQPSEEKSSFGDNFIRWTSPMKLFEYMAVGRLIIASDLPVFREVLNEKNAMLCPPGDVNSWHMALRQRGNNNAIRDAFASRAKRDVAKYDWSNRVARCLKDVTH